MLRDGVQHNCQFSFVFSNLKHWRGRTKSNPVTSSWTFCIHAKTFYPLPTKISNGEVTLQALLDSIVPSYKSDPKQDFLRERTHQTHMGQDRNLAKEWHIWAKIPVLRKLTQMFHNSEGQSPSIFSVHCEIYVDYCWLHWTWWTGSSIMHFEDQY